jgi:hypothetical protein
MCTDHDFAIVQRFQVFVINDLQSQLLQPVDFHIIMDNVAQAEQTARFGKLPFGNLDSIHYSKTKSGMWIDGYLHN